MELRWAKAMNAGSDGRITRVSIALIKLGGRDKHPDGQDTEVNTYQTLFQSIFCRLILHWLIDFIYGPYFSTRYFVPAQ